MTAPVCQVPKSTPQVQPDTRTYPNIPIAHDLQSALSAIDAMRRILQMLLNMQTANNKATKPKVGSFAEISRKTEVVRIYNPSDHTQYVDVEHITELTMGDKTTGQSWTWRR